jgi:deoxyribodipyrimidine photolyase-like uncharacterized protein
MWHSMLSLYLNIRLLQPLEVIRAVEQAYNSKNLAIARLEGFIRQVRGLARIHAWRLQVCRCRLPTTRLV